ncbi:MAG: LacI family DNA-binding transcriptional regulator [Hyphomicrobiales bacterium]|nr:LacI family DNA-binding transcriptional regulator [Hyphomicrobiales bacterium]
MNDHDPSDTSDPAEFGPEPRPRRGARVGSGRVTLSDVAKRVGVSAMTVSRVINQPDTVSPEVREKVRAAVDELGYVPDLLAGGLASSKTKLVAAIVPTLAHMMFASTVQFAADRLAAEGYQVLLGLSGYPETVREEELVRAVLARRPDALYLTGTFHSAATRRQLRAARIPVVETWDLSRKPIDMAVGFSHRAVGEAVGRHLLAARYPAYASVSAGDERALMRADAFVETVVRAGGPTPIRRVTPAPTNVQMGRETLAELADGGFRGAIFCSSDALALGIVTEARERGLRVPEDVAVIGFGDFDYAAHTSPRLSSVMVDRRRVADTAADMLLARLAGREVAEKVVDVGFEIVERETG